MPDRPRNPEVTALLQQWQSGDAAALERMMPLVYDDLRRVARTHLRGERRGHTLQPTALVHEAWLRLMGGGNATPRNRAQFFAVAARLMRQILVDHARRKQALKRGGGETLIALPDVPAAPQPAPVDILALDDALGALAAVDPDLVQLVEMKFFAGLTIDETAEAMQVSPATIERDWSVAKAFLYQRLSL